MQAIRMLPLSCFTLGSWAITVMLRVAGSAPVDAETAVAAIPLRFAFALAFVFAMGAPLFQVLESAARLDTEGLSRRPTRVPTRDSTSKVVRASPSLDTRLQ